MFALVVDNIGKVGEYASCAEAIAHGRQTVRLSGRADPHFMVIDEAGNIAYEGRPRPPTKAKRRRRK
jgi:hypothetical protein